MLVLLDITSNIFTYQFVIKAFIAIILLSICLPLIGMQVVTKRLSMIGDTLSHTSLCGIAIGLACGFLPIYIAIITSIIGGLIIELIRNKFSKYAEVALAIVMSLAIGITGILTKYAPANHFESYLFGSILTVSWNSIYILLTICIIVIFFSISLYRTNMYIAYSTTQAKVSKINVTLINTLMSVLISTSVAISSTIIGSLLVSSLLVIPIATSFQLTKSYKMSLIWALIISVSTSIIGLLISIYTDLNSGGVIVLLGIFILICSIIYKQIRNRLLSKKAK